MRRRRTLSTAAAAAALLLAACSGEGEAQDPIDVDGGVTDAATDEPPAQGPIEDEQSAEERSVFELEVGDCLSEQEATAEPISTVDAVPCDEPHDVEVYALFDLPDGELPDAEALETAVTDGCLGATFTDYVGVPLEESTLVPAPLTPTAESWDEGDREVVCAAGLPDEQLSEAIAGSGL